MTDQQTQIMKEVYKNQREHKTTKPGLSSEDLMQRYTAIQEGKFNYDQMSSAGGYRGPLLTAESLANQIPKRSRASTLILDIGSGTGLVAEQLMKFGFTTIDGVEPSHAMQETARRKDIYRNLYELHLTKEETPLLKNTYDAIVTCGTLLENHLPVEALYEFIRLTKPGGFVVIVTRHKYLQTVKAYKELLEPLMTSLEEEKRWKMLNRHIFPNYFLQDEGIGWTFSVL